MNECPLRIDFSGGWLDVPRLSIDGGYIINCTFLPGVSQEKWPYKYGGGLGGSAAKAILDGINPLEFELKNGVGWQDPAVILERGVCVWRSGKLPVLELKRNPDFITDDIYLYWSGNPHTTFDLVDIKRDYQKILKISRFATYAVERGIENILWECVRNTYDLQISEGMKELPYFNEKCKKYCGSGHGGYAFYISPKETKDMIKIKLI